MSATVEPPETPDLREAAVHGVRWAAMVRGAAEVVLMASMILLARLISPTEFGYFAVAIIAQELAIVITAEGIGTALVQRKTVDREHLQAGLALALVTGLVFMVLTLVAASLIVSPIFGARTADFVRLSSPLFLIAAAGTVPMALLRRRLAFKRLSMIDFGTSVMRVGVAVVLAIAGLEGESLVFGGIAAGLTTTVLAWASAPAPLPRWRLQAAREVMSYGLPASIASISWVGFRNCDYAIIGARLGAVQAGYYFRAYNLAVEYQKKISIVMGQVGLPLLARSGDEMSAMRGHMVRLIAILTFPLLAILAITAPELVPWLFGSEWTPAVVPMQILAVGGASTLVIDAVGVALMASGRPRALLGFGFGHFGVYAGAVLLATPWGLAGVAGAATVVHTAFMVVAYRLMVRGTDESWVHHMWADVGPAIVGSLGLVAVAVPVSIGLSAAGTPTLVQLVAVTLVGLGGYALTLRLTFPTAFATIVMLVRRVLPSAPRLPRPVPRIWKYRALSTCRRVTGKGIVHQPVLLLGSGAIAIGRDVRFGWPTSPEFHTGYLHLEAAAPEAVIEIGEEAEINNNAYIKSEGAGIYIGPRALLGSNVQILDSDFHDLHPDRRRGGRPAMAPVHLEENVFIGDGTKILKGVTIGRDSVVGAGSVVTRSIPAGVIAAGNPARVVRELRGAEDRAVVAR